MKTLLSLLLLTAAIGSVSKAADKPDFSGDWKVNFEKSDFGALPPPESLTRKVAHAEPSLAIEDTQNGQKTTRKYTTDGKEIVFDSQGTDVKSAAVWEGNAIVVKSKVEAVGVQFKDTMTLSADGKIMTSAVRITSPQGDIDITVVFNKQ